MGLFDVTPEDFARGTIVEPGWYPAEVVKVEDKPTKDGKPASWVSLKLIEAISSTGENVQNVPLQPICFLPAYPSFIIPFLNALGAGIGKGGAKGLEVTQASLGGKKLQVYVKNTIFDGRMKNEVGDYRPA